MSQNWQKIHEIFLKIHKVKGATKISFFIVDVELIVQLVLYLSPLNNSIIYGIKSVFIAPPPLDPLDNTET